MIRELGVASLTEVGWYTVIPYAFGALGILVLSRSSDRLRERRWHVASTLIVGSITLYLTTFLGRGNARRILTLFIGLRSQINCCQYFVLQAKGLSTT